jgi:hypothetical protein
MLAIHDWLTNSGMDISQGMLMDVAEVCMYIYMALAAGQEKLLSFRIQTLTLFRI